MTEGGGGGALSVFRALRLLRVLKFLSKVKSLQIVAAAVVATMGNLSQTVLLLMLFLLQASVIGLQLFSGRYCAGAGAAWLCPPPVAHFPPLRPRGYTSRATPLPLPRFLTPSQPF